LGNIQPTSIRISMFNGEKEFIDLTTEAILPEVKRSMMKSIIYRWKDTGNKNFVSTIIFNEQEVLAIFKKYNDFAPDDECKLQIELNADENLLRLFLTNNKFWYEFKNSEIKVFTEKSKDQNL
jgi:hypothetical protein